MENTATGLTTIQSDFSVKETIDRISSIVQSKGMTVFARIDHAENATKAGLSLRPTELIIFGNPNAGTLLMQDVQTSGIDLPVKALAWEDELGKAWLTYNDAEWLSKRHNLSEKSSTILNDIAKGLALVTDQAARK